MTGPAHDAGRQAQETQRIYEQQRVSAREQAEQQAAQDRATMHARRGQ